MKRISSDTMTTEADLEVLYNGEKYLWVTGVHAVSVKRRLA